MSGDKYLVSGKLTIGRFVKKPWYRRLWYRLQHGPHEPTRMLQDDPDYEQVVYYEGYPDEHGRFNLRRDVEGGDA